MFRLMPCERPKAADCIGAGLFGGREKFARHRVWPRTVFGSGVLRCGQRTISRVRSAGTRLVNSAAGSAHEHSGGPTARRLGTFRHPRVRTRSGRARWLRRRRSRHMWLRGTGQRVPTIRIAGRFSLPALASAITHSVLTGYFPTRRGVNGFCRPSRPRCRRKRRGLQGPQQN